MGRPVYKARAYTALKIEGWKSLKLQPGCAGDLRLIFPLTRDFEIVHHEGREQSFGEVGRKIFILFYQKIIKNITLTFTSCLDSAAMACSWVINTQYSHFSDVARFDASGCNSAKVKLCISGWFLYWALHL